MNREWHKLHTMPTGATTEQRIEWHLEHSKNCACRPFPKGLMAALSEAQKRKLAQTSGKRTEQPSTAVH